MANFVLNAQAREAALQGKGASRRLRHAAQIPAIIYGGSAEPVTITLELRQIVKALENNAFFEEVIEIQIGDKVENVKIKAIERQMRMTFTQGQIPNPAEICEIQLKKLIDNTIATEVKESDIAPFMEQILASFADLTKEEVIKRFVSAEFNRFIEYYERAGDLNASASKDDRYRSDRERPDRGNRLRRREPGGGAAQPAPGPAAIRPARPGARFPCG